jgi:hypothetical protein
MNETRKNLLAALAEISEQYPDWRFGQLIANLAVWCRDATPGAIWDIEDEELLAAIRNHLKKDTPGASSKDRMNQ